MGPENGEHGSAGAPKRSIAARRGRRAFTLIELLVVVGIIALLLAILLPALQGAREMGRRAVCLSNMHGIGQAAHGYAASDRREQIVPIHKMNVRLEYGFGFPDRFLAWNFPGRFCYGGRTPVRNMVDGTTQVTVMTNPEPWGAGTRPLNRYIYGDTEADQGRELPLFRCPDDRGYPDCEDWHVVGHQQYTRELAGVACYDIVGNSYRINDSGVLVLRGSPIADLSTGPQGHAASAVENPGRTVLFAEPRFFWWARGDLTLREASAGLDIPGWHGKVKADNALFADGSARLISVSPRQEFPAEEIAALGIADWHSQGDMLSRGADWQLDCYPGRPALVSIYLDSGQLITTYTGLDHGLWPFSDYTINDPP